MKLVKLGARLVWLDHVIGYHRVKTWLVRLRIALYHRQNARLRRKIAELEK